jgi:CRP/FNR family transcriptional regulator
MSTRLGGISKAHTLASLRQFSGLNDMARDFLSQAVVMGHVKRHEYLVQRNGAADSFFVVVQGRVEVSLSADSGFHKVIEIAGSGDQIGEAMMFCGGNHLIDARAITAVTYIELSKADCLRAMSLDHQFAQRLIEAMSARFVTLLADIKATNCLSARERIYQFLLNEPRQDNWVRLSITKGTIASMLGIAKETLSRELQRLSADGLIRVEGARIELIDPPPAQPPCPNLPRTVSPTI